MIYTPTFQRYEHGIYMRCRLAKMQMFKPLSVLLSLSGFTIAQDTSKYPKSVKLSYTVLGSSLSSAKQLAEVLYDPQTLKYHLSSWTPPSTDSLKSTSKDPANSQLVRISVPDGSSSVTTLSTFDPNLSQYIDLWLSASSDIIFSASISSVSPPPLTDDQIRQKRKEERARAKGKPIPSPPPKQKAPKPKKGKKVKEEVEGGPVVKVTLLKQSEGPQPKLNSRKPPAVDSEGKEIPQQEQPEKSFFQKYWWVFLIGTVLMMSGGGGDK